MKPPMEEQVESRATGDRSVATGDHEGAGQREPHRGGFVGPHPRVITKRGAATLVRHQDRPRSAPHGPGPGLEPPAGLREAEAVADPAAIS